ncbi:MAG: CotH kinase family protein [Kineosporiaceae bacterium]|nr:CotH kinase family protein [Kineosporiaceae bacterium]
MTLQDLCNAFYAIDNVLTVRVTMAPADWAALKAAEPRGGFCNFAFTGERYDWYHATSVEISGTAFPAGGPHSFTDVGISKKSFCGSFSTTKPSLRLNFSRFLDHEDAIEALIGTQYVTLHNCVQDPSYVRQPLGYELFRLAGLPFSRCNIARVIVNGEDQGTYVNCEPVRKRHIQNTFGNDEGNLYEIELGEDLTSALVSAGRLTHQGFSDAEDGADLLLAAQRIADAGPAGAAEVVDLAQFLRFHAMETLLKHWDGYTGQANNAYVYNDVVAVAVPGVDQVTLRFIPWGLDQILQPNAAFNLDDDSVLGALVRSDATLLDAVRDQLRDLLATVFSRASIETVIMPYLARVEAALATAGTTDLGAEIETVRDQVRLIRSGGLLLTEVPPDLAVALVERGSGECAHASQSESVGMHQEVYHHPLSASRSDRWFVRPVADGVELVNEKFGTFLHASSTIRTAGGNLDVYAFRFPDAGNAFWITPLDVVSPFKLSGYLMLTASRSGLAVRFSATDLTPAGNPQVHLAARADATALRLY